MYMWIMVKRLKTEDGAEDRRGLLFISTSLCGFSNRPRKHT